MRLRVAIASLASLGAGLVICGPARASGDFTCTPTWTLAHGDYASCDNTALLTPGNDTRVNLILLWADARGRRPAPDGKPEEPMFDWPTLSARLYPSPTKADDSDQGSDEGSRCLTAPGGAHGFEDAVAKGPGDPPAAEQAVLVAARQALPADCNAAKAAPFDDGGDKIRSAEGKAFQAYLQGAGAFYAGDFDTAAARFAALKTARSPWLRETGRYMVARVEVNRMLTGVFDDYGAFKQPASAEATARTVAALDDYLHAWPKGLYADSARGFIRRAWWLGGRSDRLAAAYAALAAQAPDQRGLDDIPLAQEIDNKLLASVKAADVADPVLLAVVDLQQMRAPPTDGDAKTTPAPRGPSAADLEAQRPRFAGRQALFGYLLAARAFYMDHQPAEVLRLIPDAGRPATFDTLAFSRQVLRGMALDALKDPGARGFWLGMVDGATGPYQRPAVELAIAWRDERAGSLTQTFAAGSPVRNQAVRAIALSQAGDALLLRAQARAADAPSHERQIALFTLLYKELTRGRYADYLKDAALIRPEDRDQPKDGDAGASRNAEGQDAWNQPTPLWTFVQPAGGAFACPTLAETAARLARDPTEARARMCLSEWVRTWSYDGFYLDSPPPKGELGGAAHPFPGPVYSRLETYRLVIADAKAGAEDRAYALYRAVNCYGPSGYNHCGGTEASSAQRKAWFLRLKQDYAASPWSQKQKIYW